MGGDQGPYLALSFDAVAAGLRRIEDFGGSAGQSGLPEERKTIAGILEPRHGQIRRVFNNVVAFHKSQAIEPYLQELASTLIESLVQRPEAATVGVDVMKGFVEPIPPRAMARLAGFPEADADRYYEWGNACGEAFAKAVADNQSLCMADAVPAFTNYVEDRIDERLALPQDQWPNDALTRFLTLPVDGEPLSRESICVQVLFMIGAGSETTRNHLGNLLYRLATRPDLYARLRADRSLVDATIEESLRLDAPAQFLVRDVLHDTEVCDTAMREGEKVIISIAAGNHDPAVFPEPSEFDPDRSNGREHLTFGHGPHICPGAALARLESRVAVHALLDHVAELSLADGYEFVHASTGMMHGPRELNLRLIAG